MPTKPRIPNPLSLTSLLVLACLATTPVSRAQDKNVSLSLSIFIVDEIQACRPNGYLEYSENKDHSRHCEQLNIDDIEQWRSRRVLEHRGVIPPQTIAIPPLLPFLEHYIDQEPINLPPDERKAAVMVFDWGQPNHAQLSFQRVSSDPDIPSSPRRTFRMSGERRWIYHQRADALMPSYGVEWVLQTETGRVVLRTLDPRSDGP